MNLEKYRYRKISEYSQINTEWYYGFFGRLGFMAYQPL